MNQKVQLLETQRSGPQVVVATVICKDGVIDCDNKAMLTWFARDGIAGKNGKRYYPKDGTAFLKNLHIAFSGSMLRATKPMLANDAG